MLEANVSTNIKTHWHKHFQQFVEAIFKIETPETKEAQADRKKKQAEALKLLCDHDVSLLPEP